MSSYSPDTTRVVSAPGKIMLAGEYAILEGAQAIVMAIERRVRARLVEPPPKKLAPMVSAVREEMAESTAFAGVGRAAMDAIRRVEVDSSALYGTGGTKLGLGSSAATAVVAAACALSAQEQEIPHDLVQRLAHRAHGSVQERKGARGSGADIAACTYGGILAVQAPDYGQPVEYRPLTWPDSAHLICVWTGQAADTPSLVQKVRMLRIGNRDAYEQAMGRIAVSAAQAIDALEGADVAQLISAVDAGAEAIAELGQEAGAALVIEAHERLRAMAREFSGAAKPTGAGGGDVAIAVFADADNARGFAEKAKAAGLSPLDRMEIASTGVQID